MIDYVKNNPRLWFLILFISCLLYIVCVKVICKRIHNN